MSWWDELKKPLYKLVAQDSRNAAKIGNWTGWDYLEEEGKKNTNNPGRAVGKAAAMAASMYLGGMFGGGAGAGASGAAGAGAGAVGEAALYEGMSEATKQALMQQAAQEAAKQAATEAALQGGGGMFGQIPGVTSGSQQAQMLGEQTGMFGGQGADMTARSAMPAVRDAYQGGRMGAMDYAGNVAKADAAGMNDPRVWMDRLGRNASRIAGNKGAQQMALRSLAGGQQQQPQGGGGQRAPMGKPPEQITTEGGNDLQKLLADYKSGRISEAELKMRLSMMGVMA